MKVVVTGASGVLGRAVANHFHTKGDEVIPLAFSRTSTALYPDLPKFIPLDLLDVEATRSLLSSHGKIDALIHCAAERRPDAAEKDPARAEKLNKDVVENLATICEQNDILMVYISTDYVFDGKKPPYSPEDQTNPLQFYGRTKAAGEQAILSVRKQHQGEFAPGKGLVVLRIPILYGEVEYNAETAVNIFVDVIENPAKETKMDHFAVRFPTNVADVARVCFDLAHLDKPLPPILHFSSQRRFTKYEMTQVIAKALGKPIDHVISDTTDPSTLPDANVTPRPGNTQLSVKELEALGIDAKESQTFEEWWAGWAQRYNKSKEGESKDAYEIIDDLVARYPVQGGALYTTFTDLALSQQWQELRSIGLACGWSALLGRKTLSVSQGRRYPAHSPRADSQGPCACPKDPLRLVLPMSIDADSLTPAALRDIFTELDTLDARNLPGPLPSLVEDDKTEPATLSESDLQLDKEAIYISIATQDSTVVYYRLTKGIKKPADIPNE